MKRLGLVIILLFMGWAVFSQEQVRYTEFEDFLYGWDVEVTVHRSVLGDEVTYHIRDNISGDEQDVRNTLATVVFAIVDEAEYLKQPLEDLDLDRIVYSWKDKEVVISLKWIKLYARTNRDKSKVILVNELVKSFK